MERQYVAVDLHSRRSMIVRENEAADQRQVTRIDNDPMALAAALAEAGPDPEVAIEATYGWYWDAARRSRIDAHWAIWAGGRCRSRAAAGARTQPQRSSADGPVPSASHQPSSWMTWSQSSSTDLPRQ